MVLLRFLHPRQDSGRREGVADVLVDGRTREDDADDLPSRSEQRTPRIARKHGGIEGVAQRLAQIWAMVAELDPGLAARLPRYTNPAD